MDLNTFIISVFCRRHRSYRSRGPAPKLSDSEVITMEIVTESLGIDTDNGIYTYFKRHHPHYFPKMREIHRTTFTPQAANLWVIKEMLWQHLLTHELVVLGQDEEPLLVIDSFPIPICKKSRSYRCKVMRELSERKGHYFGQVLRDEGSRSCGAARDNSESERVWGRRP